MRLDRLACGAKQQANPLVVGCCQLVDMGKTHGVEVLSGITQNGDERDSRKAAF